MANAEFNVVISLEMLHRVGYFLPSKKTDISGSGFNHRLTNCDLTLSWATAQYCAAAAISNEATFYLTINAFGVHNILFIGKNYLLVKFAEVVYKEHFSRNSNCQRTNLIYTNLKLHDHGFS